MAYLILFLLVIFLVAKYEKTVCFSVAFYAPLSMIRITNSINLFQIFSILCLFVYFAGYKKNNSKLNKTETFPFLLTLIVMILSHSVTNLFQNPHWPTSIAIIMSEYAMAFLFWNLMQKENNVRYFYLSFRVFMMIVVGYCVIEFLLQDNPLYRWYVNSSLFMGYDADRSEDIRFGSMRCHSIMRDVGALGTICCMGLCVFFSALIKPPYSTNKIERVLLYSLIFLCIASTFLTGTRTVIIGLLFCMIICSFCLTAKSKIRLLVFIIILCLMSSEFLYDIYLSFVDTKSVVGSSADMRELQWAVVLNAFESSPVYGLGLEGTSAIMNRFSDAFGLESVWFQLLINFGFLGAMAFSISVIQGFLYSIKNKCLPALAVVGMFLIVKTMSSIPGIGNGYFLYLIIYLVAYQRYTNYKKNEIRNNYNA